MEFGKFADATSLYEGYLNLEKEFTKKCQELGEVKSRLEKTASKQSCTADKFGEVVEAVAERKPLQSAEAIEEETSKSVEAIEEETSKSVEAVEEETLKSVGEKSLKVDSSSSGALGQNQQGGKDDEPAKIEKESNDGTGNGVSDSYSFYKSPEWRKEVNQFFASTPDAKSFKADIARILATTPELEGVPDRLSFAFALAKNNRPAPAEADKQQGVAPLQGSLTGNQSLLGYFQNVVDKSSGVPQMFVGKSSGEVVSSPKSIRTFEDATRELLKNYFRNN